MGASQTDKMTAPRFSKSVVANGPRDMLALWEICSVVTSCLIAEWVVLSFVGRSKSIAAIPVTLSLGLIAFSYRERGETLKQIGFRLDNLMAAVRLLLLPTILAVVLIFIITWIFAGSDLLLRTPRPRFLFVPLWALFQQAILQGFINRRAQMVLGPGLRSILLVAIVFSLVHLPNLPLAGITLLGGLVWAAVYQREPNLFALALSHSIASIALALWLPPSLINSLRVGFKYFG